MFCPGNLTAARTLARVDFAVPIIDSIERKVEISKEFEHAFDNKRLAVM